MLEYTGGIRQAKVPYPTLKVSVQPPEALFQVDAPAAVGELPYSLLEPLDGLGDQPDARVPFRSKGEPQEPSKPGPVYGALLPVDLQLKLPFHKPLDTL
jgi:hypothetical protein